MIRAVFDCNVFWQIFFSETGVGRICWNAVIDAEVELFVSQEILDEVRDVLTRPETNSRFSKATEENVEFFIEEILENATFVHPVAKKFEYRRDPKDEPYINLAVQTEADYIVSRDKDLLSLMTGFDDDSKSFRQQFRPLKIVDTLTFVQLFENAKSEIKK